MSVKAPEPAAFDPRETLKLDRQLCFPLYACARKIVNLYTPLLKPLGLTYTQYIALLVLWERDGIPVSELCEKLYLDNGTVTPMLKKLESAGILRRERDREDGRIVTIALTEYGRELEERALEIPRRVGRCVPLAPGDAGTLYRLLYDILQESLKGDGNA